MTMNAYDIAECHRLVHDRGLKGWKFLLVRGNPDNAVNSWLTLWNSDEKMVMSIGKMKNGPNYYAHAQRVAPPNTWMMPTRREALALALDKWLEYIEAT